MGRSQVLAVAILGAWITSTLCMWFAATRSFATVERVLKRAQPQFVEITKPLGEASTRVVLRYMASEINRTFFWGYGALQIGSGGDSVPPALAADAAQRRGYRRGGDHAGPVGDPDAGHHAAARFHRTEHRFPSAQSSAARHAALLGAARVVHGAGRRKAPRRHRPADPLDFPLISGHGDLNPYPVRSCGSRAF